MTMEVHVVVHGLTRERKEQENNIKILSMVFLKMKSDNGETKRSLTADQQWTAERTESCCNQSTDWEECQKSKDKEFYVIHDTIKLLCDTRCQSG